MNPVARWLSILHERDWHLAVATLGVLLSVRGAAFMVPGTWAHEVLAGYSLGPLSGAAYFLVAGPVLLLVGQWQIGAAYNNRPGQGYTASMAGGTLWGFQAYHGLLEESLRLPHVAGMATLSLLCLILALRCRVDRTGR